jgi:folate-binding protein YgfZ
MSTHENLGSISFSGPDAAKFLQGQLSADVEKLAPGASTLAGLHNPQGRAIALLNVSRISAEELHASLPLELAESVGARLRKYVLRAKVRIDVGAQAVPGTESLTAIRSGIPEVYANTSEAFVAQMLNLDLLGAIAFDKGCYTGQEVIARAHYRGRVKRRMQRWLNDSGSPLGPGDTARAADGRSLTVVRVASLADGNQVGNQAGHQAGLQEILAIGTFAPGNDAPAGEPAPGDGVRVSGPLPLPYPLPE